MRDRVDAFGVSEPELARTGEDQIEVNLPGVADAERAAKQVGSTAQLFFYDWEKNVLDENCKTNDTEINGGQQPVTGLYNAVKRAVEVRHPGAEEQPGRGRLALLRVRQGLQEAVQQRHPGRVARRGARRADRGAEGEGRGHRGQARRARPARPEAVADAPDPDAFWIIRDDPGLSGTDIKNPEQNFDQQGGNEPIVTFDFSDKGRKAFQTITARVAQRGADNANPLNPDPSRTRSTSRSRSTTSSSRSR